MRTKSWTGLRGAVAGGFWVWAIVLGIGRMAEAGRVWAAMEYGMAGGNAGVARGAGGMGPTNAGTGSGLDGQIFMSNRARALAWAERTRLTIVPTMHLVETEHFLIFSAWNRSNDSALTDVCERMYRLLAGQFNLYAGRPPWIGKCPIYIFWDPAHYSRFIAEIDRSRLLDPKMARADGYHASRGMFSYIVINGVSGFGTTLEQAKIQFYEVLVHEGTHAFMSGYVSRKPLPLWIEEGLADYIAAVIVPLSEANRKYITASRMAARKPEMIEQLFKKKAELTSTEYGIAESLVRSLVRTDGNAMVRFLTLLKQGKEEEAAMMEAYHFSRAEFVRAWMQFWQRSTAGPAAR